MDQGEAVQPLPDARRLAPAQQVRLLILAGLAAAGIALAAFALHLILNRTPPPPPPLPPGAFQPTPAQFAALTIVPVRVGADADLLYANGSIAADADHSTPVLLPYSGQVKAVYVEPGQYVHAGQALLRIASPELVDARNNLNAALAQQASAAKTLSVAQATAARQRAIYETAGGALKDYAQAQNDLVNAQSAFRSARSAVQAARDRLALFGKSPGETSALARADGGQPATIYRAPVSGVIADRSVAPGQFIQAGGTTPLLTITDPAHVWLVAQLDESDAANVRVGDHVRVTTPALPGREFLATIDNVAAALDPATHRLPVRATIPNPDGALKPQMFASFAITRTIAGGGGVLVPAAAVIHEGDGARVWLVGRDRLLYARTVTTGETEGGYTRVTRGLAPGDRIVAAGALFVNEAGENQ